jgi:hypothetical protein
MCQETPQNAGFCAIYPTASEGLDSPDLNFLASHFASISNCSELIVRYLIIIIINFIAVSFYTNKSFMPNT